MEKLALIQMDTRSATLTIVNYTMSGSFVVDKVISEPLNLVQDMDRDGYLKPSRIEETINLLRSYRNIVDAQKLDNIVCLADRTFGEARNQLAFFDEIYKTVSLLFKIIDIDERISTIHQCVLYSMAIPKGIILDVQDEYINIIKFNRRLVLENVELPFGIHKLADNFMNITNPEEKLQKMTEYVASELSRTKWLTSLEPEYEIIGVGETFISAGKLVRRSIRYPLDVDHNFEITNANFTPVYNLIKTLDLDKSKKLKGISAQRVDMLAAGMAVIKASFAVFITTKLHVNNFGLTYGSIIKTLFNQSQERPLVDVLGYSLSSINEFYPTAGNITEIYNVTVLLYKQLKVLHKLNKSYLKVFRIAASMSTSGKRISYIDYEKNCFNVICGSNVLGATHKEIVLAAFVAASQNVDDFSMSDWVRFKDLVDEDDIEAVKKLAIIIRIAGALCCSGQENITDITCDVLGDTVILKTEVKRNASLEISQAMACADDFRKVYKKNLQIL